MDGIILYQSKYGATKKYAGWLAEETGFPCVETKKADIGDVQNYDAILLGGGIYASGIACLSFLKKHIGRLRGKRILVFCVGASPYEEQTFQAIVRHNLKGDLAGLPCFYCRGAWDLDAMHLVDKNLCRILQKAVAKKDPAEYAAWEKALMAAGEEACDWTDKAYLEPILAALRQ